MNEQDGPVLRAWYERLTGMMLVPQLDSRVVQSVGAIAIHLCSDGRYIRTFRLQSVPGRRAEGEESGGYHEIGTWLIEMRNTNATQSRQPAVKLDTGLDFAVDLPTEYEKVS